MPVPAAATLLAGLLQPPLYSYFHAFALDAAAAMIDDAFSLIFRFLSSLFTLPLFR